MEPEIWMGFVIIGIVIGIAEKIDDILCALARRQKRKALAQK